MILLPGICCTMLGFRWFKIERNQDFKVFYFFIQFANRGAVVLWKWISLLESLNFSKSVKNSFWWIYSGIILNPIKPILISFCGYLIGFLCYQFLPVKYWKLKISSEAYCACTNSRQNRIFSWTTKTRGNFKEKNVYNLFFKKEHFKSCWVSTTCSWQLFQCK